MTEAMKVRAMYANRRKWLNEGTLKPVDIQLFIKRCQELCPLLDDSYELTVADMKEVYHITRDYLEGDVGE